MSILYWVFDTSCMIQYWDSLCKYTHVYDFLVQTKYMLLVEDGNTRNFQALRN